MDHRQSERRAIPEGPALWEERHAADFNDDAIGRALLKLFESQCGQIYSGICRQAVDH